MCFVLPGDSLSPRALATFTNGGVVLVILLPNDMPGNPCRERHGDMAQHIHVKEKKNRYM